MKVYVAAASREIERARAMMEAIRNGGHRITHNWIPSVEKAIADGIREIDLDEEIRRRYASEDVLGAASCEVFVGLVPPPDVHTKGLWWEMATACASPLVRHVFAVGPWARQTIFTSAPGVETLGTDLDAVARIGRAV